MEDSVVKSVDILLKDNIIRNLKKKLHQNQTKNKRSKPESMFALNCMGNCFHSRNFLKHLTHDPMSADGDNLACRLHVLTRHNSERGPLMTISQ